MGESVGWKRGPTRPYVFLTGMIEAVSQRHGNNTVAVGIFARGNKA